ncbi:serine hydrolase domain-containing protein [Leucobacter luti]|uniref:serine hydrolase domain-containing protein n=1 Tax=Leucobacter luti TaxID=340320 RepID=UPI001404FA05|nr:serine hydrolase domain-containing protein [Leucobacter luti]MCW2287129.1 D-alanyl-D-alanine carboxypeptidase [Leucobacter luti]
MHSSRTRAGVAALAAVGVLFAGCTSGPGGAYSSRDQPETPATSDAIERPVAPSGELSEKLQDQLQAVLEKTMEQYGVPGAAAGVWLPGTGSWTTASGLADIEAKAPVTEDMSWPIRSITKSYTVTMLLELADEGTLSLDDTLESYVPGVTNGDQITLLELANMSSGVADYVTEEFFTEFAKDQFKVYTLAELNSGVLGQPAQFAPGTKHVYTNANTNLLGAVIEKATGSDYATALQERILDPLRQADTEYITDVADWTAPHAVGYMPDPDSGGRIPADQNPSILGAAGAMFSTLDDGRVWAETLGSGALLRPETQALREVGNTIEKPPYDLYAVGMGETQGWLGHNGEGLGFTAATFHNPGSGASIVIYMNTSNLPDGSHPADQAFRALAQVVADAG